MLLSEQALPRQHKKAPTKCAYQFKGTVGSYLREIGRVPLVNNPTLTAKAVQRGLEKKFSRPC